LAGTAQTHRHLTDSATAKALPSFRLRPFSQEILDIGPVFDSFLHCEGEPSTKYGRDDDRFSAILTRRKA
jgi:hypothetical protein